ncbi:uncharacterized protein ARMOST_16197 [Armillaria ostoyae]|uniref:Integrase zinc-binding domain-containing protein n=1 Tax=Armillaria ostoyae TaxID=47428 RepID=A0A284RVH7_ARMOS|nr:uncharacterized protein ARMOST_16197 [Armillaria ostoyae]
MAGHLEIEKMKELVLRDYWWPKLKKNVETYIQACKTYARTKSSTQARQAPLHLNEILSKLWTHISVDMVTGLPHSNGYNAILVIIDRFSKAIILVTCNEELSSKE